MHRDADLLLRPPLASIGMLDWQAFDRAVEILFTAIPCRP